MMAGMVMPLATMSCVAPTRVLCPDICSTTSMGKSASRAILLKIRETSPAPSPSPMIPRDSDRKTLPLPMPLPLVQEAGLIERGARSLELTAPGRSILDAGSWGALQALLFRVFFWHMDLSLFVGWLVRRVPGRWPQNDIGVVLWALAGVAAEWQSADTLAVSCTDPENPVPHGYRGRPAMLFVSRVLVPLCWFGVIEWREMKEMFDVRRWRKTGLFDRLLSFNVRLADGRPHWH